MAWANTMIAVCATILGFATSAVVAEVRHADHLTVAVPAPAAQSVTAAVRVRSIALPANTDAIRAPKRQVLLALAAGPNARDARPVR